MEEKTPESVGLELLFGCGKVLVGSGYFADGAEPASFVTLTRTSEARPVGTALSGMPREGTNDSFDVRLVLPSTDSIDVLIAALQRARHRLLEMHLETQGVGGVK